MFIYVFWVVVRIFINLLNGSRKVEYNVGSKVLLFVVVWYGNIFFCGLMLKYFVVSGVL